MTDKILKATHAGEFNIGDKVLSCAVLEDGTRVLTQERFLQAIGRSGKPAAGRGSSVEKVAPFLAITNLKPFVDKELEDSTKPIIFKAHKGSRAYGYKAELLPKVCEVYLKARDAGALHKTQERMAQACDILMRGLAHVGIVALVDEATGYQYERAKNALAEILENFIAKEIRPWVKTFPDDFYVEMFRLKGWQYIPVPKGKPVIVGKYTNDIVYARLAPYVLEELKKVTPKNDKGQYKARFHQSLTENIGYQKLKEHLAAVTALMRASANWDKFKSLVNRALPRYDKTLPLFRDID